MYNRYIRNDNGVYDRVPQQETAPPSPPRPQPPPPRPGPPPPGPEPAPPPAPAPERQFLNRLLAKLHLGDRNWTLWLRMPLDVVGSWVLFR